MAEATAFGVAMAAGIASGVWQLSKMTTPLNNQFNPLISTEGDVIIVALFIIPECCRTSQNTDKMAGCYEEM